MTNIDETKPVYKLQQWNASTSDPRYLKWFVVGYNIRSSVALYLRADGTWQDVMVSSWLPNGGTYFTTRNEAEIALAKTGKTDHTESVTAEVDKYPFQRGK